MKIRFVSTSLLMLLSLIMSAKAEGRQEDLQVLEPGQSIKRKIAGQETHYYRIVLMADQYLRLVVDQRGIDVGVKLYLSDGKIAAESNRLTGAYGPETISYVATSSGFYKLEVRALTAERISSDYVNDPRRLASVLFISTLMSDSVMATGALGVGWSGTGTGTTWSL